MQDSGRGLFQEWFSSISSILNQRVNVKEFSAQFGLLQSDEERVAFGLSLACLHEVMKVEPCFNPKSAAQSTRLRYEGNKLYQKDRHLEALDTYTCSILNAPVDCSGNELSLALANRSAVLFKLKNYPKCLEDIQQALSYGYPMELRYKLLERRGKCLSQLGRRSTAIDCFEEAKKTLTESKLDKTKRDTWMKELEMEISVCRSQELKVNNSHEKPSDINANDDYLLQQEFALPQHTHERNTKFRSASCCVDIITSPKFGRHPVATQDIFVGDILVIEKPFASVLLPEHLETHCYHCLKRVTVPMPCCQCTTVRYCSVVCAKQSWDSYHSVECQYLNLIHKAKIGGNGHLALRIIAKARYKFLKNFRHEMRKRLCDKVSKESGCRDNGSYISSDYLPIYCLVTHSKDRSVSDLFRRTVMAIFLLKTLQGGGFFGKEPYSQDDLIFIGGLILRHLQSNPCNAHEVSELQLNLNSVATSETGEIASGIYATLSLFNHACDPSVTRNFYGDTCVLRAIKNIPKGEEISDNYGTLCALTAKAERQKELASQYYFTCHCRACKEDFPLYLDIPNNASPVFKCQSCHIPLSSGNEVKVPSTICSKCHCSYDLSQMGTTLKESTELFEQAIDALLLKADVEGTLTVFLSHLGLLEELVCRPWQDYNKCQEAIKQCYSIMGNCHVLK